MKKRNEIGREALNNAEKCYSELARDVLAGNYPQNDEARNYSIDDIRCLREQKNQIRQALLKGVDMVLNLREMEAENEFDSVIKSNRKILKVVNSEFFKSEYFCNLAKPVQREVESLFSLRLFNFFIDREETIDDCEWLNSSPDLVKKLLVDDFDCSWPEGRMEEHAIGLTEKKDAIVIFTNGEFGSNKVGGVADCMNRRAVIKTSGMSQEQIANIVSHENRHLWNNYLTNFDAYGETKCLRWVKDEIVAYLSQKKPRSHVSLLTELVDFDGIYSYYRSDFDEEKSESVKKEIYRKWLKHCRAVFKAIYLYFVAQANGVNLNFDEMMMVPMNEWPSLIPAEKRRQLRINSDYYLSINNNTIELCEEARVLSNYLEEINAGKYVDDDVFLGKAGLGSPKTVVEIIEDCEIEGISVDNYEVYSGIMILYIYTNSGVITLSLCPTLAEIEKYEHEC